MGSKVATAQYIADQIDLPGITYKRMFGEFGLYHQGAIVAFICDDVLYVKPTDAGRALMSPLREGQPYPNAKPHLLVDDGIDDSEWLTDLIRATSKALAAAPKAPAKPKARNRSAKATTNPTSKPGKSKPKPAAKAPARTATRKPPSLPKSAAKPARSSKK